VAFLDVGAERSAPEATTSTSSAPHHHPWPHVADADARDLKASLRLDHNEARSKA
jgi:hypothetical protein